jgi:hypothetical protein
VIASFAAARRTYGAARHAWYTVAMEHHAYLIVAERSRWEVHIEQHLSVRGVAQRGNADLRRYTSEQLGVDEARAIKEAAYRTAGTVGGHVWHVVCFTSATHEAQNALLKVLEEPPASARFLLCVAHDEVLLPTVRSRLLRVAVDGSRGAHEVGAHDRADRSEEAIAFLAASIPERLKLAERMVKDAENDPHSVHRWLDALEVELAGELRAGKGAAPYGAALQTLFATREFLYGRSPSRKLLTERLALTLPVRSGR